MLRSFLSPYGAVVVLVISAVILYLDYRYAPHSVIFDRSSQHNDMLSLFWSATGMTAAFAQSSSAAHFELVGESAALSLAGDVGYNVRAALDASNGALRSITILPGETWSFNASIGHPSHVNVRVVAGVPGGGWCDLASRYVQALRPVLPPEAFAFPNHVRTAGIGLLNVANEDAVAIWNIDGQPGSFGGRQDLQITNTTNTALRLEVVEGPLPDQIVVRALRVVQ
ncbi:MULTISPECIES: hypothetical protein [unclassified Roseiflexus]|jgi:hypothetical protein|uniref:hypothetical protein n=1 Tax=unclassified Roseiflexus TaxID=2609473 RepID=UPI0000D7FDFA|nr:MULTISPECIES: hypothetical protein [unclassified Roseiflexus]ABQ91257.1 hypothetical protein RoseRS_2889 [Roseiflexus sp. RS-1]MCL6540454.1 VanW family protein [Roseiflexus sp.]